LKDASILQQQKPFPPSYPADSQEDEINLIELIRVLVKRKFIILSLTVFTTLIAIGYAFLSPSVYEAKSILLPPTEEQLEFFNIQNKVTVANAFTAFKNHLYSDRRQVFESMNLLDIFSKRSRENANAEEIFAAFNDSFTLIESQQSKKSGEVLIPLVTLSLQGFDAKLIADYLNNLVRVASENSIAQFIHDGNSKIVTQQKIITRQIEALRESAINKRNDRIEVTTKSLRIAKKMGIKSPVRLAEGAIGSFLPSIPDDSLLYLQGENYLASELDELLSRKTDDPFIPELRPLQTQLAILKTLSLELGSVSVMNVNQVAYASDIRIKPKRSLIVALGVVLGLMVGVFAAFFLNFLENQKKDEV